MFLSNSSSTSLNNNNNCIDQQPMFDRPFFINDVSPSSKMYPHPLPIQDDHVDHHHHHHHHHHHQNLSAAADDQDFIAAFLQQHQDLLVGHQFSQLQQQNTSPTSPNSTTTTSNVSKQTGIINTTTATTDHQINLPLNNMNNMEISNNKNVVDGGGSKSKSKSKSRCEPAVTVWKQKKKNTTSKKDRHSKIVTAQGPRDRRMRLSLEIARRFFTLQDMLGFDKASKTVEWLLTKSKGAIKEVTRRSIIKGSSNNNTSGGGGGTSSTSECEVVSVFDDHTTNVEDDENSKVQISSNTISNINNPKEKRIRKPTFHPPPLAKDSRANARVRARERTIEKMRSRSNAAPPQQQPYPQGTIHNMNQLRANYSSSYETGGEESAGSQSHDMRSTTCLEMVADHPPAAAARSQSLECQCPNNIGGEAEEYSFVITTRNSTTSPFFDYNHEIKTSQGLNLNNNNCNNFPENWGDIDSGSRAHSSYYSMANNMHLSTTDFQFVSKPWIT